MNSKELQLVNYEQAKRLKKAGYIWNAFAPNNWYDPMDKKLNHRNLYPLEYYPAPPVALALKWIRDEKHIFCSVGITRGTKSYYAGIYFNNDGFYETEYFDSYEPAEYALLDELLNILEKEQ